MQDVRFALRAFRKQPVFSLVAILTLTLGIGANTAIFSVLYRAVLRPMPFPHASRLVAVGNVYLKAGGELSSVAIPDYLDRRTGAPAIEDATLFTARTATLATSGDPEQVIALAVTPSFFTTFERAPFLGRAFFAADVQGQAAPIAILTYGTWRARFGSDPSVVGRMVRVNGVAASIVGVLPADFEVPWRDVAMLVPFAFTPAQRLDSERGNEFSSMIARLRSGASIAQLDGQMDAITASLMTRVPDRAEYMRSSGFTGRAMSLYDSRAKNVSAQLYLLQASVVLVLLIACANVGNLLLMRTAGRQRELAIRTAIGAGAGRIIRQMLTEGMILAAAGGVLGAMLGVGGASALTAAAADQLPQTGEQALAWPVLFFAIGVSALAGLVFGLLPALPILRGGPAAALKEDSTRGTASRKAGGIRRALVVIEAALAVVLLVGAGLLAKSFIRLAHADPGFDPSGVLTAQISLPASRYGTSDARRGFWLSLLEKTREMPGVTAAGLVSVMPLSGDLNAGSFDVVGRPTAAGQQTPHALQSVVMGEYFRAMGIPFVEGRNFASTDGPTAQRVAIIDGRLAARFFPKGAIGQQLNFGSPRNYTIVGVVRPINAHDLAERSSEGQIYLHAVQIPDPVMGLAVKAPGDAAQITSQIRAAVKGLDAEQPIARVRTMSGWIEQSLQPHRTPALLVGLFGALSLLLSAIGIYGVLAFGVAQRQREFGIRQALGADRQSILSLVLLEGLRTAGLGLVAGTAVALVAARFVQTLLYGVTAHDPQVFAGSILLLLAVAGLACAVPAWRATRVDPIRALRLD